MEYDIQPWRTLDIDVSFAERKDFDFNAHLNNSTYAKLPGGFFEWRKKDLSQLLNLDWLKYMKSINLEVDHVLGFYRKPFYQHPEAHVDMYYSLKKPAVFALNYVIDPQDDSEMVWYKFPEFQGKTVEHSATNEVHNYETFPIDKIKDRELARHTIGRKMTMVSVGIPHNVIMNQRERWCLSFRITITDIDTWDQAVDYMEKFIVC
jgi:hypothetical protein